MARIEPLPSCEVTAAFTRLGFAITGERGPGIVLACASDDTEVAIPNEDPVPPEAIAAALRTAAIEEVDFLAAL